MPANPFKRLILRAVLRDVYPMVIRLVAIPDTLYLTDFDDIFHAVLGWDCGIGYAFQIQGQEFNSFQRKNRSKKIRDFGLHRQEKFLYTLGALDQWEWELRVIDLQDGTEGDQYAGVRRRTRRGATTVFRGPDRISTDAEAAAAGRADVPAGAD